MLYELCLAADRKNYMNCSVPGMDPKRPFYYDVVEAKPFKITSEEDCDRIQVQLLTTFLKGGGQLWVLDDLWTQLGILTVNSASTSDLNWNQERISVSRSSI